jgi:hypothetical protein
VWRRVIVTLLVAASSILAASAAQADPPTPLGGISNLNAYCQSLGYTAATLQKGFVVGEQAAYNNWRCYTGTPENTHPFNFEQACKWAYGLSTVQAHPLDAGDAFTWVCYSTQHA